MKLGDLELVGGAPPRAVDLFTTVTGHQIGQTASRPAFCGCGERQPSDWSTTPQDWRELHLKDAWPVVSRRTDETKEEFLGRLSEHYVEAKRLEQAIEDSLGLNRPVAEGQEFPTITDESADASELAEVLHHQMESVREDLLRTSWAD